MKYKITLKTPVHIGSGEKLSSIDSMPLGDRYAVIDIAKILEEIKNNSKALNEFEKLGFRFKIKDFLNNYKINPNEAIKYTLYNSQHLRPWEINEMVKTGFGNPLIPGTSLKGALRTVIFWHLFKNSPKNKIQNILSDILKKADPQKRGSADDLLDHYLLGKDPNYDLLRSLQVGDAEFEILNLQLIDVKVLTLDNRRDFLWKKMGRQGFNTPDPLKATSIYCEALPINTASTVKIKPDKYLLEDKIASTQLDFSAKKRYFFDLPKYCNEFANNFISQEIEFFEGCKMGRILNFYKGLQKEISQDDDSFLLHLGWGSGWRGMTGNYLEEEMLSEFRQKFTLGKMFSEEVQCPTCGARTRPDKFKKGYNFCFNCRKSFPAKNSKRLYPVFPKTRKIVFENNQPKYPLGWIKLEII